MTHLLLVTIYLAFVSLGLPDSLLGAAWPSMYPSLGASVASAGLVSLTITVCTVISSLASDRLVRKFGTGVVTAVSTFLTAAALFGFSLSTRFWMLLLWALPYGLGAGSIDAALNNFVALHFHARHMSWLHCFWGLGAAIGPQIMAFCLVRNSWQGGYRTIATIQFTLTAILLLSLPLWKKKTASAAASTQEAPSVRTLLHRLDGRAALCSFFFYCSLEMSAGLWSASYLVLQKEMDAQLAASLTAAFYVGITVGRIISGFLTVRMDSPSLIRAGEGFIFAALIALIVLPPSAVCGTALFFLGFGCAPVYPCLIHETPRRFGQSASQAMIGLEMAAAYVGSAAMPPLAGLIVQYVSPAVFPAFLCLFAVLLCIMTELLRALDRRREALETA